MSNKIKINDFDLLVDTLKSLAKIVDSAKFIFNENGLEIYSARKTQARCELVTNAVYGDSNFEFSILNLSMLNKVLQTIKDVHDNDYSELSIEYVEPAIKFSSKKIKTRFQTCGEDKIKDWISKKITAQLQSVFDFTTTNDYIKRVNSHSFMFSDPSSLRIYIATQNDMEANAVYATLGNKDTNLSNEITLKFGFVTSGTIPEGRSIIFDIESLNVFNALQQNEIKMTLTNYNCVVSKSHIVGKNDSFLNFNIYASLLKN